MKAVDLKVGSFIKLPGDDRRPMLAMKSKPENGKVRLTLSYGGEHITRSVSEDTEVAVPYPWPEVPPGTEWA